MRLEFEAMRDSMLQAAGRLDRNMGGASVDIFKRPFSKRRTVYKFIDRQNLPATLRNFDFAIPDSTSPGRYQTTVPQQALYLMNSPFIYQQAQATAEQLLGQLADPEGAIRRVYRHVLCRRPRVRRLSRHRPERQPSAPAAARASGSRR